MGEVIKVPARDRVVPCRVHSRGGKTRRVCGVCQGARTQRRVELYTVWGLGRCMPGRGVWVSVGVYQ